MEYKIVIVKENGTVSADLRDCTKELILEFNISNVIGDFIAIRKSKQDAEGHRRICYDLASHVFSGTFDAPLGEQEEYWNESKYDDVKASFRFLKKAMSVINDSHYTFLKKQQSFRELMNVSNVGMTFRITLRDYNGDGIVGYNTPVSDYVELKTQDSWFDYTCHSTLDMVAAVMHYYMMNNYKLVSCQHCGRYYATANLKQKYCQRVSPYHNQFSQKTSKPELCEATVRRELQYLMQKKNRLLNRVGQSPQGQTLQKEYYLPLTDKCAEWVKTVKKYPTPENFDRFSAFLEEKAQKKEWRR